VRELRMCRTKGGACCQSLAAAQARRAGRWIDPVRQNEPWPAHDPILR
jgi:hypothetical protein